jgi:hypothetical protein
VPFLFWYVQQNSKRISEVRLKVHQSVVLSELCLALFETLSDVERQEAHRLGALESSRYSKNIANSFDALQSDAIYLYDIQR